MRTRTKCFRIAVFILVGVLPASCAALKISGTPVTLEDRSGSAGSSSLLSSSTPVIREFSMAMFRSTAGPLFGGIAIDAAGDVWATAAHDVIHVAPDGSANELRLYLRGATEPSGGFCCLQGIVWRNDNTIWYGELLGEGAFLGETNSPGADLNDIDLVSMYGVNSTRFVTGNDHRIWFPRCGAENCSSGGELIAVNSSATHYSLGSYIGNSIASGPDLRLYVTERSATSSASSVAQVTTSGAILHRYSLPNGSVPSEYTDAYDSAGIANGGDNNLWIAEAGTNEIARMTTNGVVTQFHIPTPNSRPQEIVLGNDGNLWFTEFYGNKIGRITPAGVITEYPVPTPNAGLTGIANCRVFGCPLGPHGHIWFVESAANKVGRLDF
jgi:sugar lactone lactonase YvrE